MQTLFILGLLKALNIVQEFELWLPISLFITKLKKLNSVAWVLRLTISTERPPLVGLVSANFCTYGVPRG
jgi:hypothetical protein